MLATLVGAATLILRVTYPPFQDFPNNLHVLELDRAIDSPAVAPYFQRPQQFVFGYSLVPLLNRVTSDWISTATSLRLMFILAALGVPLGVARVARATGVEPLWACFLALPLAFSWPLKMGFVQFSLALAASLFAIAAAVRAARDPRFSRGLELALWICLTYMAHALALGIVAIGLGLAWLDAKRSRLAVTALLGLALLPAAILASVDLANDAFSAIPETSVSLEHHTTSFRTLDLALAHLFTRSYGLTDSRDLLWYGPLLLLLIVAAAATLRHHRELRKGDTSYLLWAVPVMILACIGAPEATERIYFIGSRLAAVALAMVTVLAAVTVARAALATQLVAVAATVLALLGVFGETISRAASLVEILGREGPERVSGRFLTAKLGPCADADGNYWGRYESERHLWAYALALDGVTPYLFSWSRYHPVQYRGEIYSASLRAPQESINGDRSLRGSCEAANLERLRGATYWNGYDGALITARPDTWSQFADFPTLQAARLLSPGLRLTRPPNRNPNVLRVRMNHFESAQYLGRGWSEYELTEDRTVRWNNGSTSEVSFELAPEPGPYELLLTTHPFAAAMPQSIAVTLNGESIGQVAPATGWNQSSLLVPRQHLRQGPNHLGLEYGQVVRPSDLDGGQDHRQLAVMFDAIEIVPVSDSLSLEMDSADPGWSLEHGWSGLELMDGRSVRWSDGPNSALRFRLDPTTGPHRLTLAVQPYEPTVPQTLTVTLNNAVLETLAIDKGWQEYSMSVPEGLLQLDENVMRLEYGNTVQPAEVAASTDTRNLALLFDALRLVPSGGVGPASD